MMWSDMHDAGGGWLAAGLWLIALWLLVVVVTVALTRGGWSATRGPDQPSRPDPLQLLDERFARGEIDPEEYQERRALLRQAH